MTNVSENVVSQSGEQEKKTDRLLQKSKKNKLKLNKKEK